MINASTEFKNRVANGTAKFLTRIYIDLKDTSISRLILYNENIWSSTLSIEDAISADSDFQVGTAIVNKVKFSINNIYEAYSDYDFNGAKVMVFVGQQISSSNTEWLLKGTYIVDEATYNGSIIELECLDYMSKLDKPISSTYITLPATLSTLVQRCCSACSVFIGSTTFPNSTYVVRKIDLNEATTYREVIAWCAQIAGCCARCNPNGYLEMKWYDFNSLDTAVTALDGGQTPTYSGVHQIRRTFSHNISVDDVVITKVAITVKKDSTDSDKSTTATYTQGTDGYTLAFSGNDFITTTNVSEILTYLATRLIGLKFRKANVSHIADPTMEAGDVAIVFDRKGNYYPIVVSKTIYAKGNGQTTVSAAQTPARNSATRFSSDTKNYVDLRNRLEDEKTARDLALEDLSERLNSKEGLYSTVQTATSGNIYYLHDHEDLVDSSVVWKMTAEAWGVTTDYNGENPEETVWNAGMTVNGDTIVRILTATGINADWINAGAISIGKTVNGVWTETFYADTETGVVRITADSFKLSSGETIQSAATSAANSVLSSYVPANHMTQEQTFNLLTNNGALEGIYMESGELYINFSYAKGGTLKLGGSNNRNGRFVVYNSSGNEIVSFDKDGAKFCTTTGWAGENIRINENQIKGYVGDNLYTYIDLCANYNSGSSTSEIWMVLQSALNAKGIKILTANNMPVQIDCGTSGTVDIKSKTKIAGTLTTDSYIYTATYVEAVDHVYTRGYMECNTLTVHNPPWSTSSDLSLKMNIEDAENQLEKLMSLKLHSFDWKDGSGHVPVGLVAQELKEVCPELVLTGGDGNLRIDYINMVPYLLKAVQELKRLINK